MESPPASSVLQLSRHGTIGLPSLSVDATCTYRYIFLQLQRRPKMDEWMDCLRRHRVLPSWDYPVIGEIGKSSRKWRELLWLRYDSSSLQNKSILETKKWRKLSLAFNIWDKALKKNTHILYDINRDALLISCLDASIINNCLASFY